MQLQFKSLTRPRRAAKALSEYVPGTRLNEAQAVVARMCGYPDWVALKQATEQPGAVASADDEELAEGALSERLEFQAQQVRAVFGNTLAQAQEVVRLCSPTARNPAPAPAGTALDRPLLRGANVWQPPYDLRFAPSYPEVFGILFDVARVRLEFVQPEATALAESHLASRVRFWFANGKSLELSGSHFWKFLDDVPSELLDARGAVLNPNPYSKEPVLEMLSRLRMAYGLFFQRAGSELRDELPPLWVELDLAKGTLTRRNPAALQRDTVNRFWHIFERHTEAALADLQPLVDRFMVESLQGSRVEMHTVTKGGRGSPYVGNEYVRNTWAGTGHWTMKDLLMEVSPAPFSPSGCGGNLRYEDLFEQALQVPLEGLLSAACLEACQTSELYAAMHAELELPALKSAKPRLQTRAQQLLEGLRANRLARDLVSTLRRALVERQSERVFSSWNASLVADPARERPTVRLEKLLASFRRPDAPAV